MTDNKKLLQRARKILEEFHIADIFVDLHQQGYRYESTQSVDFSKYAPPVAVNDDIKTAVILRQDGHEMVLGFGSFSYGNALADSCGWADAYIYFDEDLVFHTTATKDCDGYDLIFDVQTYAFSLKSFKAGPWLELLGKWYGELVEASKQRDEDKKQQELAQQASNIDLGDYK